MTDEQIEALLAQPITAQLATNGPTIRPLWFAWEDGAFWFMSGPWAKLLGRVRQDPEVALCIDVGDFVAGVVQQVCVYGAVSVEAYDVDRARRMLYRYLGPEEASWSSAPSDYRSYIAGGGPEGAVFLRLTPRKMIGLDLSYAD